MRSGGRARIHDGRRDVGVGGAQIAPGYLLSIFFDIVVEGAEGIETPWNRLMRDRGTRKCLSCHPPFEQMLAVFPLARSER